MIVPSYEEIMAELSRRSYADYVEYTHKGRYKHGKFTMYLCNEIQQFIEAKTGNAYDILMLSVPPQHGKSMTISETLPSYLCGKVPESRTIIASYNDDFAKKFLRRNKEKLEEFGPQIFQVEVGHPNTANELVMGNKVGGIQSRGLLSGITGNPAEFFIIDDPIKNQSEADSEVMRDKIFAEWEASVKTRLAPGAKVIIIQTRWHKDDLIGRIIQSEKNIQVINFPCECDVDIDVLGRTKGDSLFPEMGKDNAWLKSFKEGITTKEGTRVWNALYQGKPTNEEGSIFKKEWFRFYERFRQPQTAYKVISVDATFKDGKDSDKVAIQVWGKVNEEYYLLYRYSRIMGFVDTIKELKRIILANMDYKLILIEDKANGSAIIDVMKRMFSGIIPVQPEGGKQARAYAVQPLFESGCVFIPSDEHDYLVEMCDFPTGEYDDDVDATTQALNRLRQVTAVITRRNPDDDWDEQLDSVLGYM